MARTHGGFFLAVLFAALSAACVTNPAPDTTPGEPPRARAAVAALVVQNRTAHELEILYRLTTTGSTVSVGRVAAEAEARTAPVPAAEPVILIARRDGGHFSLRARTFDIGGSWTWVIPADAAFVMYPDSL